MSKKISRHRERDNISARTWVEEHRQKKINRHNLEGRPVVNREEEGQGYCSFKLRESAWYDGYREPVRPVVCRGGDIDNCLLLELMDRRTVNDRRIISGESKVAVCKPILEKLSEEARVRIAEIERKRDEIKAEEKRREREEFRRIYGY